MKKLNMFNRLANFVYAIIMNLPFVWVRVEDEKKAIIAEYTDDEQVKKMYKGVLGRQTHILNTKVLDVKRGTRRYSLLYFETPEGQRVVNLGRREPEQGCGDHDMRKQQASHHTKMRHLTN